VTQPRVGGHRLLGALADQDPAVGPLAQVDRRARPAGHIDHPVGQRRQRPGLDQQARAGQGRDLEADRGRHLGGLGPGGQHTGPGPQQLVGGLDPHPVLVQTDPGPAGHQPHPGRLQHRPAGGQHQRRLHLPVVGGKAGRRHRAEAGPGQQPGQLGRVDAPDRVATAAGLGHPPGQPLPFLGVADPADLAGPAQPDLAADAASEPRPARHARTGQLEPGHRVLAQGRDRPERPARAALPGPLRVDQDRPHPPVDQMDRDRAPQNPGPNHHHLATTAAIHTHLLCQRQGRQRACARHDPSLATVPSRRMGRPAPRGSGHSALPATRPPGDP
jgi:hypothetical protein